jgi:hypothetical protein
MYDGAGCLTEEGVTSIIEAHRNTDAANESANALVALGSPSSSSSSPHPSERVPPEQVAIAWIDHLQKGGSLPDTSTLVELLQALVVTRVPCAPHAPVPMATPAASDLDVKMIVVAVGGKKFPHMLETDNGRLTGEDRIWTQCKTKMTHFCVRLVDSNGAPVAGTSVQPDGLKLRLTLHKVVGDFYEPLDDDSNPRPSEGLFRGRAGGAFQPEATLTESRYEFRFQVLLLSSDIGGERMCIRVAPTDPQLASNPNLCVQSHSFASRARMPDESFGRENRERRADAASQLVSFAASGPPAAAPGPPPSPWRPSKPAHAARRRPASGSARRSLRSCREVGVKSE